MRRRSLRTKEKALEIPKLSKLILLVHNKVAVFFSHLSGLRNPQEDLRNQLFYTEKSLTGYLESMVHDQVQEVAKRIRKGE